MHRDIKPLNALRMPDGALVVSDKYDSNMIRQLVQLVVAAEGAATVIEMFEKIAHELLSVIASQLPDEADILVGSYRDAVADATWRLQLRARRDGD